MVSRDATTFAREKAEDFSIGLTSVPFDIYKCCSRRANFKAAFDRQSLNKYCSKKQNFNRENEIISWTPKLAVWVRSGVKIRLIPQQRISFC